MKILLMGDSNTMGVYNALIGVYPGGAMKPLHWDVTLEATIAAPLEWVYEGSLARVAAHEQWDVVVISAHIGNAIAGHTGATYKGQPVTEATALPHALASAEAWEAAGAVVFLTGGHGCSPLAPVGDPLFDKCQAFYCSYLASLNASSHAPVFSYRLPRRAENWPAAPDYIHASPTGYRAMADRLVRQVATYC